MALDAVKQHETEKSGVACVQCESLNLRRSHFRQGDLGELLRLHWPVRCRECSERQYISVFNVAKLKDGV